MIYVHRTPWVCFIKDTTHVGASPQFFKNSGYFHIFFKKKNTVTSIRKPLGITCRD